MKMEIVIPTHSLEKMIFEICNLTFFREIGTGKEPDAGSELQKELLNIQNTELLPNAPDKREIIQPPNLGPNKIW